MDWFVARAGERLYNVQNGDIWGSQLLGIIAPTGDNMIQSQGNQGFSYHEDVKFQGKSSFLKDFYEPRGKPEY